MIKNDFTKSWETLDYPPSLATKPFQKVFWNYHFDFGIDSLIGSILDCTDEAILCVGSRRRFSAWMWSKGMWRWLPDYAWKREILIVNVFCAQPLFSSCYINRRGTPCVVVQVSKSLTPKPRKIIKYHRKPKNMVHQFQ